MGFLGGSGKAAAVSVGAFVGFLAVGDSRLWGLEFEAEVTILTTFFKVGSTNAFYSIKTILWGNVPEEYRGASSQSSSHSIVACRRTLLLATETESVSSRDRKRPCALRRA